MIVRSWRAHASKEKAVLYLEHVRSRVFPEIANIAGHKGALVLRRHNGNDVEILVLTLWASMQAVTAFAGADPNVAVVEPEAEAMLLDYDRTAQHYEVMQVSGVPLAI